VALILDPEQGTPLQEPMIIKVPENTTVTQHLFFTSEPPPATATVAATVAAVPSPLPTAAPLPTAGPVEVEIPRMLPETAAGTAPRRPVALGIAGGLVLAAGLVVLLSNRRAG
jgi:hypothetical protein